LLPTRVGVSVGVCVGVGVRVAVKVDVFVGVIENVGVGVNGKGQPSRADLTAATISSTVIIPSKLASPLGQDPTCAVPSAMFTKTTISLTSTLLSLLQSPVQTRGVGVAGTLRARVGVCVGVLVAGGGVSVGDGVNDNVRVALGEMVNVCVALWVRVEVGDGVKLGGRVKVKVNVAVARGVKLGLVLGVAVGVNVATIGLGVMTRPFRQLCSPCPERTPPTLG